METADTVDSLAVQVMFGASGEQSGVVATSGHEQKSIRVMTLLQYWLRQMYE